MKRELRIKMEKEFKEFEISNWSLVFGLDWSLTACTRFIMPPYTLVCLLKGSNKLLLK